MPSLVQRFSSYLLPNVDTASVKVSAYKACKGAVSFLMDNQNAYLRAGLALAYDLWKWDKFSTSLSATNAILTIANTALPYRGPIGPPWVPNFGIKVLVSQGYDNYSRGSRAAWLHITGAIFQFILQEVERSLLKDARYLPAMLGVEGCPDFQRCTSIHEFCDQFFPPFRASLPSDWQQWVINIPKGETLSRFEAEARLMKKTDSVENWAKDLHGLKLTDLLEKMKQKSPLFAIAWDLANKEKKVLLKEADRFDNPVYSDGNNASYHFPTHTITIEKAPNAVQVDSILFETINALQRQEFQQLDEMAENGMIGREESALLNEWIEENSYLWCERIKAGDPELAPSRTFEESWECSNTLGVGDSMTHADYYRKVWDKLFLAPFHYMNRLAMQKRAEELRTQLPTTLSLVSVAGRSSPIRV
jgi:hypothetical protein